ncbi:hypothetical protein [Burkholderia cepacia]|uniref:Uncharacterized protein n=1 Tax=Burkholderia cepacia TaxID=292 RepID=A0ABM6P0S3_BURCE|nr:hypothetical protein [Burkholderia cepacia]AIO26463.1 hypothetical protein DM41_7583 [Burkholderia cepacia ATCC 25416]ASE93204.1 hypothetical protein CEQ23_02920 [Burkholderia cepacia]ATF80624.1 hypothetical protein CO711_23855 [Burkholderia cepacia]MCA8470012.1 hypothetical protein [Burkholderia cepacia]MDN7765776.1 hypothetical protein [Burkholderia cepacia]
MNAASNARQANKTSETSATDARRSGDPHTVTPTRPRVRAAKPASRDARRPAGRGLGDSSGTGGTSGSSGPVAAHDGDGKGNPLWEDDGGAMPPEEWS